MSEKFKGNLPPQEQKSEIDQELLDLCKGNREAAQKVLEVRNKYDTEWWNSDDPMEVAWGQLNEPTLIMDFDKFHEAIEKALGRPVFTHEFGINAEELKKELEAKKEAKK